MKKIYLAFFAGFTILGLIICFENISIPASGVMILFDTQRGSMFNTLFIMQVVGLLSGIFLGLALASKDKKQGGFQDDMDL